MKPIDRIMKDNVPGYSYMKKAMPQPGSGREPKNAAQKENLHTDRDSAQRKGGFA